eukprot:85012_1
MTGKDSAGDYSFACSGFEIYGNIVNVMDTKAEGDPQQTMSGSTQQIQIQMSEYETKYDAAQQPEEEANNEQQEEKKQEKDFVEVNDEFKYESDFDENGICYNLATNFKRKKWQNPAIANLIFVSSNQWNYEHQPIQHLLGRNVVDYCESLGFRSLGSPWFIVDFTENICIKPTHYTLRCPGKGLSYLRNWNFEGSRDGVNWILIRQHENESKPGDIISCSGFEIYGKMKGIHYTDVASRIKDYYKTLKLPKSIEAPTEQNKDDDFKGILYQIGKITQNRAQSKILLDSYPKLNEPETLTLGKIKVQNTQNAWFSVDFVGIQIRVTHFAICATHTSISNDDLKSFDVEGTNNDDEWFLISRHQNEQKIKEATIFEVKPDQYFRKFRVRMTGTNTNDQMNLFFTIFDLYGDIKSVQDDQEEEEKFATQIYCHRNHPINKAILTFDDIDDKKELKQCYECKECNALIKANDTFYSCNHIDELTNELGIALCNGCYDQIIKSHIKFKQFEIEQEIKPENVEAEYSLTIQKRPPFDIFRDYNAVQLDSNLQCNKGDILYGVNGKHIEQIANIFNYHSAPFKATFIRKTDKKQEEEKQEIILKEEFEFKSDFDKNGICYALGTNFGATEWTNPAELQLIKLSSSGWFSNKSVKPIENIVGRDTVYTSTTHEEGSWIAIDFTQNIKIKPTDYTLRHANVPTYYLRNWNLEASNDGINWILITQHENEEALSKSGDSKTFKIPECNTFYSQFRIKSTGKNSGTPFIIKNTGKNSGDHKDAILCSGFEIYGSLEGLVSPAQCLPKTEFKYESDFDNNGIVHFLGCNYAQNNEWQNPAKQGIIAVFASSIKDDSESIEQVVGQEAVRCLTAYQETPWIVIDFKGTKIKPTYYTLRHFSSSNTECLRFWNLEASNDGIDWIVI